MSSANIQVLIDRFITSSSTQWLKIKCWFNLQEGTAGRFLGMPTGLYSVLGTFQQAEVESWERVQA